MPIKTVTASHATGKGEADVVFAVAKKAEDAIAKLGKDKVVNGTIGAIYDDAGSFAALPTVNEHYRTIAAEELMNYAPIAGIPAFLEAAVEFAFQEYKPEGAYIKAVATPGGTGAIHHVFFNYMEQGHKALIPDWFWAPYRTIAQENMKSVETYQMFDKKNEFTVDSLKEKSLELLKSQNNLVTVFNTPAHNPTGYTMSVEDWTAVLDFYKECAKDETKRIIILIDMAYIDYAGPANETRKFMKLFSHLPANILVTFAFSMSKSFLIYGMRSGALICVTSSQEVAQEFYDVNSFSNRGTWSNGTRGAQRLLVDIMNNPQLRAKTDEERNHYMALLEKRAGIFLKEAKEVGLVCLPYYAGFFLTIPSADPQALANRLEENNIFVVPLKKGIRLALCGIATYQIPGLAAKIKAVF